MALDRRNNASKAAASSQQFASIQERRVMKKVAQPEHAYTGCVPYTPADDESDGVPKKKNAPILGYRGHLRRDEDRVGTTFTQGLAVASRPAEPVSSTKARLPINQPRHVRFAEDKPPQPKPPKAGKAGMSPRSGYGRFDNASEYGNFAAPPKADMSPRSGYGEFENASGYGAFAAPPQGDTGMSPRSGYGAFDNASGYGAFAAPPGMSPRSGYGAFDNASGYGAFAAPPEGMSPRSGYGEFDNASGYGAFAAPPGQKGYGVVGNAAQLTEGMSPRSGYGAFDNASGYGAFAAPPDPSTRKPDPSHVYQNRELGARTPSDAVLQAKYQQAIYRVGGEQTALRLWISVGQAIWQRYISRTELLQAVKRSFEKHERASTCILVARNYLWELITRIAV
ncbi:hypothetical protein V7S43_008394 [Phytophthora oleae]|uniref:Uncharacterized protein n=1 Tax=Phytophthora oleae TaxID=2107226 RepID=A0ABD3FMH7_9STRA